MVVTDTVEGLIDGRLWFHYDVGNDVLCLRVNEHRRTPTTGEMTDDEFLLLRREDTGEVVGVTIVNWWGRFGQGDLPDSREALGIRFEETARSLPLAA